MHHGPTARRRAGLLKQVARASRGAKARRARSEWKRKGCHAHLDGYTRVEGSFEAASDEGGSGFFPTGNVEGCAAVGLQQKGARGIRCSPANTIEGSNGDGD